MALWDTDPVGGSNCHTAICKRSTKMDEPFGTKAWTDENSHIPKCVAGSSRLGGNFCLRFYFNVCLFADREEESVEECTF